MPALEIIRHGREVVILDRLAIKGHAPYLGSPAPIEVQTVLGESGMIQPVPPIPDSHRFSLIKTGEVFGEIKLTQPLAPEGIIRAGADTFTIEARGPWIVLMSMGEEVGRLTPAWKDSQSEGGVLAEIALQKECDDWVLASLTFTWLISQEFALQAATMPIFFTGS